MLALNSAASLEKMKMNFGGFNSGLGVDCRDLTISIKRCWDTEGSLKIKLQSNNSKESMRKLVDRLISGIWRRKFSLYTIQERLASIYVPLIVSDVIDLEREGPLLATGLVGSSGVSWLIAKVSTIWGSPEKIDRGFSASIGIVGWEETEELTGLEVSLTFVWASNVDGDIIGETAGLLGSDFFLTFAWDSVGGRTGDGGKRVLPQIKNPAWMLLRGNLE
jgi:hypothetical protein